MVRSVDLSSFVLVSGRGRESNFKGLQVAALLFYKYFNMGQPGVGTLGHQDMKMSKKLSLVPQSLRELRCRDPGRNEEYRKCAIVVQRKE